jgi:hypothetical protein
MIQVDISHVNAEQRFLLRGQLIRTLEEGNEMK